MCKQYLNLFVGHVVFRDMKYVCKTTVYKLVWYTSYPSAFFSPLSLSLCLSLTAILSALFKPYFEQRKSSKNAIFCTGITV